MPKIVDHDLRRSEIAQAFFRVVLKRGIEGATTREIAREASASLGVLSHYFGDKDGLVLAAFEELAASFTHRLAAAAMTKTTAAGALEALCLAVLPLDAERRVESGVWISFWAHGYASPAARRRQDEGYAEWVDAFTRVISALPRARSAAEAAADAVTLVALLDGLTIQLMLRGPRQFTADQAAATVRRHLETLA